MLDNLKSDIRIALTGLPNSPLLDGARSLLNTLGYHSQRTLKIGSVNNYIDRFLLSKELTERQKSLFASWRHVEFVFQITDTEVARAISNEVSLNEIVHKESRAKSLLFLAVDLESGNYSRTTLSDMTRAASLPSGPPVIILFRHSSSSGEPTLTIAIVHRRPHKRDDGRDVLERVTLIKDIRLRNPHRAHVDVLADIALPRLLTDCKYSFDKLHAAWVRKLDIDILNKRFYRELFAWFEKAVGECKFPDDGAGEGSNERHVIRLITRLLFIWFLKEKGLVPECLFENSFARRALVNHAPDASDYYRAILQNLFFATLNTEIGNRSFDVPQKNGNCSNFSGYRYRNLLANPDEFINILKQVPFVNGGLFDCLDYSQPGAASERNIDVFTDNPKQRKCLHVPARILLDDDDDAGLFGLFRRYKFTIEENTPLDCEVALDPELLGRAFENLLAAYNPETRETARKRTGSYYTPREIVDYMVREAVAEALAAKVSPRGTPEKHWRDQLGYLLDWEDANADAGEFFTAEDAKGVVDAIANLKILDPAVGSGAFPMGILHTLTLALRRLDPNNTMWEQYQISRAADRAGEAFHASDPTAREDELSEISKTFERYRSSNFGRKLYLIQSGIYGVDNQPVACQIAKLRFFISLIIEQEPNAAKPNQGIIPLPNLETRFIAADTLREIHPDRPNLFTGTSLSALLRELKKNREAHFLAATQQRKSRCVAMDARLRGQLADELARNGLPDSAADKVASWNPYDQRANIAHWFDPEWMFGISGGFDIVIGNPPYIQLQRDGGRLGKLYAPIKYDTFERAGDVYQLFYERGCRSLARETGVLAYITSNSWLKAEYGRKQRRWLVENCTPLRLIEMGKDVFEEAIVDISILLARAGKGSPCFPAVDMDCVPDTPFPPHSSRVWASVRADGDRPWMVLSQVERTVMEKMEAAGTPLRDWDISIYRGITTGYNKAFVVDQATRDNLVAADARSAEILKPMLRGRDIDRYRANWSRLWLITTFPSLRLNIDDYPAIKRHLLSFGYRRLAQDGLLLPEGCRSRKKTPHAWYELQDSCAYHDVFQKPKLLWRDMAKAGAFTYYEGDIYCNDATFIMTGENLKFLCAVLNSFAVSWYMRKAGPTTGMGLTQWKKFAVEDIPVVRPDTASAICLSNAVTQVMAARDLGDVRKIQDINQMINVMVSRLYGLNSQEIKMLKCDRY